MPYLIALATIVGMFGTLAYVAGIAPADILAILPL